MLILVTYDVSTETKEGRGRLRRVAKICESYGQRVQKSVFECQVDPATRAKLRTRLLGAIKPEEDSLRFYVMGESGFRNVEHHGLKPSQDMRGTLIV
ncbi:CRISPR-associated endonuclease Cas2 [Acanthopleuribacter pedis]|uniref:CRISPR-associated endoribonuclease Cas2 n=1 Tax=Acanthopleuribacter pedis TaxID=442870 RepID=A0A8J7QJN4_9BACT|nr:CRISPR-associated endonuclease Cas2 [Acanthopleuribacter pedis]MBO1319448.1 CRISPR-associated endonuclease Cas2 [Acanthopleuribacter pedis]